MRIDPVLFRSTNLLGLTLTLLGACASPAEVVEDPPKEATSDVEVLPAPDVDPYFRGTRAIHLDHGPRVITRRAVPDGQGRIWLASWDGVVRLEGTNFVNVTNQAGLRRYRAFTLLEDRDGILWIGTVGAGIYRYDGTTYTNLTTKDGLVDDVTLSIFQDREGDLWFGGHGATRFDGTHYTRYGAEDGFTSSDVNAIAQAPDGDLWFGTRGALFRFDGATFEDFTATHGVQIESYVPVLVDRRGHVWFGGQEGLHHFDGTRVRRVFEPTCFSLLEDAQGRIWFSGGALQGQDAQPGTSVLNRIDPSGDLDQAMDARHQVELGVGALFELTEGPDGSIWFGSGGGAGRVLDDEVFYY